jgi:phenylpyruvate tautomerase PptA (4-oxalocrotonate tautomerase family)
LCDFCTSIVSLRSFHKRPGSGTVQSVVTHASDPPNLFLKAIHMPISIQISQGLLTPDGERHIFAEVADALLDVHGLRGNAFLAPAVIGHLHIFPGGMSFAGGKAQSLAVVEVRIPSFTFPEQPVKNAFIQAVTDIVDRLQAGEHPRERTFVNVVYTVDGTWGIGGVAYTDAALASAIQAAAA